MDLDFKAPEIKDRGWVSDILKKCDQISSEFAFGTLYLWSHSYNIKICRYKDFLLKRYGKDQDCYSFPCGTGDLSEAIKVISNNAAENGKPLKLIGVTEDYVNSLKNIIPNSFVVQERRDIWDYVYNINDMIYLKGSKYHRKRNHISKFKKMYNWEYCDITENELEECRILNDIWFKENSEYKSESIAHEYNAIKKALKNYKDLGLIGGLIRVNGKAVGFTMGEKINDDVFLSHFEKALKEFDGSYSVINREFSERLSGYKYINREEDMGIPGLRKSKLSYYPFIMVKKYDIILER